MHEGIILSYHHEADVHNYVKMAGYALFAMAV